MAPSYSTLLQAVDARSNALYLVGDPGERLRVTEEQIAVWVELAEQPARDVRLAGALEVDEHVAAEDQVELAFDRIVLFVEVEATKLDEIANLGARLHLAFLRARPPQHETLEV